MLRYVEGIDDYKEHLDFHFTANQVAEGCQKASFIASIGWEALETLVNPTLLKDLSLK